MKFFFVTWAVNMYEKHTLAHRTYSHARTWKRSTHQILFICSTQLNSILLLFVIVFLSVAFCSPKLFTFLSFQNTFNMSTHYDFRTLLKPIWKRKQNSLCLFFASFRFGMSQQERTCKKREKKIQCTVHLKHDFFDVVVVFVVVVVVVVAVAVVSVGLFRLYKMYISCTNTVVCEIFTKSCTFLFASFVRSHTQQKKK